MIDSKSKNRREAGFSLGELLIVIAIIGVLGALAVVGVVTYQKNMKFFENEGIAKEIFIAAQNHLTMANSQGMLDGKTATSEPDSFLGRKDGRYYYFVTQIDGPDKYNNALDLMLPFASVDETVRKGGSYIIQYYFNESSNSAVVTGVFYSGGDGTNYGKTFTPEDYSILFAENSQYRDLEGNGRNNRKNYDGKIIGYWGADYDSEDIKQLTAPAIDVHNEEKLYVVITNPNTAIIGDKFYAGLRFYVKGVSSGATWYMNLIDEETGNIPVAGPENVYGSQQEITVVLDDITTENGGFSYISAHSLNVSGAFLPGEDLEIYAEAYSNKEFATIADSAKVTTNSLFSGTRDGNTVKIANIRHLENLDKTQSALDINKTDTLKAEQISDISWDTFASGISSIEKTTKQKDPVEAEDVKIFGLDKKLFRPLNVKDDYKLDYNGNGHSIIGLTVNVNDGGGLFEAAVGAVIQNLELLDMTVTSTDGNAGALAGTLTDCTVTNVIARNNSSQNGSAAITGSGNAGGLIGNATNCTIDKCAAALIVNSKAGNAGGLIGSASGATTISASYSGGHTADGKYTGTVSETGVSSGFNVTAGSNAGGLAGSFTGISITNSYSTCSASGASSAGGLVGSISQGTISNCYATGLVNRKAGNSGAFAGNASNGVTFSGCQYFEIINEYSEDDSTGFLYLEAVNSAERTGITALDASAKDYNDFVGADSSWTAASSYDTALKKYYSGKYNLRSVKRLGADILDTDFVATHYGDWPAPEIFIINTAS